MKMSLHVLFGLSIAWSTAIAQNVDSGPSPPETYYSGADCLGTVKTVKQIKKTPAPNRSELRKMIQQQQDQFMGELVSFNADELLGNNSAFSRLELAPDQRQELKRCIENRLDRVSKMFAEFEQKYKAAKNSNNEASIRSDFSRQFAELGQDMIDEFKPSLLPHQRDQLEKLLKTFGLQAAVQACSTYEVSFFQACSLYLELNLDEEQEFTDGTTAAIKEYEKRIEKAKQLLAKDLLESVPESKRKDFEGMLDNDASWIIDQVNSMAKKTYR